MRLELGRKHAAHTLRAWTEVTEFFESTPDGRDVKETFPTTLVEYLLEGWSGEHYGKIQEYADRAGDRDAIDLGDVTFCQMERLVPKDVGLAAPPVPQGRDLDDHVAVMRTTWSLSGLHARINSARV